MNDSLALVKHTMKTDENVILFCGVHFIYEMAKIMNPKITLFLYLQMMDMQ